jgi:ABC-2 type transport system ATP-binding protein
MSVLEINGLNKSYGKIKALQDLNLTIEAGNVYGILGPNGSGKTTTLGVILGILKQDSGNYIWFDDQFGEHSRMKIGAILETPNFFPYLHAIDNLEIVKHIKKSNETNFDEILELVNLSDRKFSKFRTYSLGMKQRLAIAATMVGNPEVIIFDEPTNGLDPQGIAEVRETLQNVAATGKTVIMASHILDEVEKICSHVAIIKNGHLLATGTVGSILSNDITVEISSENKDKLNEFLSGYKGVGNIIEKNGNLEFNLAEEIPIGMLSNDLFKKGIVLTHLVARKKRLEEEFLEITK